MILAAAALLAVGPGCHAQSPTAPGEKSSGISVASGVLLVGRISHPDIRESSGVAASRQFPGTLWTHNDGGGLKRQVLYGITRTGRTLAEFQLIDLFLTDWEDIAIDDAKHLYVADIGNNDAKRDELAVHQFDEPDPALGTGAVRVKKSWRLRFPARPFNCESLFIWKEYGYVVSKVFDDDRAEIYRFPLADATGPVTLQHVAKTKIESPVTGADISADGKRLALVAKSGVFLFQINGDVARAHKEKGAQTKFRHEHIEGCCFVPDGLLCTAESREVYLFTDPAFQGK